MSDQRITFGFQYWLTVSGFQATAFTDVRSALRRKRTPPVSRRTRQHGKSCSSQADLAGGLAWVRMLERRANRPGDGLFSVEKKGGLSKERLTPQTAAYHGSKSSRLRHPLRSPLTRFKLTSSTTCLAHPESKLPSAPSRNCPEG